MMSAPSSLNDFLDWYLLNQTQALNWLRRGTESKSIAAELAYIGITKALATRRQNDRRLVKIGRSKELSKQRRTEAEQSVAAFDEVQKEAADKCTTHLRAALSNYADSVLAKWKINSRSLGDLTPEELKSEAEFESRLVDGHSKNCSFYLALAAEAAPQTPIKNSITPDRADAIRVSIFVCAELERAAYVDLS